MSSDERSRLHPASLLFLFFGHLRGFAVPIVLVIVFSDTPNWEAWSLVALVPLMVYEAWHYFTLRYWITPDELIVKQGVIFREERHIPLERIQAIDSTQNLLQRLFRVVEVRVETAGSNKPEAHLRVLSLDAFEKLRHQVVAGQEATPDNADSELAQDAAPRPEPARADAVELLRVSPTELLLLGMNPWRGIAILLVGFGLAQQFKIFDDTFLGTAWDLLTTGVEQVRSRGLWMELLVEGFALFLMALFILGLSIASVWISFWGFSLKRRDDEFVTECGLFTRHATTIKQPRVQFLSVGAPLFLRFFERVLVKVRTAGSQAEGNQATSTRKWLTPVLANDRIDELVGAFVPGFSLAAIEWHGLSGRAKRRMLTRTTITVLLLHVPLALGSVTVGLLPYTLPVALLGFGWLTHKQHQRIGWAVTDQAFLVKDGYIHRRLAIVPLGRIQSLTLRATPFDRRHGMQRLHVDTAGSGLTHRATVADLMGDVAERLVAELSATAEARLGQTASPSAWNSAADSAPANGERDDELRP